MVLDGLKKAERFVTLLRSAGFHRPDGKIIKAEHFDLDFENRQHEAALCSLLSGLELRILSHQENARYPLYELCFIVFRLEYLAQCGVLDGLLDNLEADMEEEALPIDGEIKRLECMVSSLEQVLEQQVMEEKYLQMELEKLNIKTDISVPILQVSAVAKLTSNEYGTMVLQSEDSILKKAESKVNEILHTRIDKDPLLKMQSVSNHELLQHGWNQPDFAFYNEKIDLALLRLNEQGILVTKEDILLEERYLSLMRQDLHLKSIAWIEESCHRYNSLTSCCNFVLQKHVDHLDLIKEEIGSCLEMLKQVLGPLMNLEPISFQSAVPIVVKSKHVLPSLDPLSMRVKELLNSLNYLQSYCSRLLPDSGEVNPITHPVKEAESDLRQISLLLSSHLQEFSIITSRTKLCGQ